MIIFVDVCQEKCAILASKTLLIQKVTSFQWKNSFIGVVKKNLLWKNCHPMYGHSLVVGYNRLKGLQNFVFKAIKYLVLRNKGLALTEDLS